ncbi:MAG: hypothetical protein JKX73_02055 [Flavobacteriales bacterium]|nr:hypothetical protein [Flavobacteriales bacterium]
MRYYSFLIVLLLTQNTSLWSYSDGGDVKVANAQISNLNKFSEIKISRKAKIEYLNYDWNLNT